MNNFLLKHSQFSSASFLKTAIKMLALFVLVFWSVPGMGQTARTFSSTTAITEAFTGFAGAAAPTNWGIQGTGTGGTTWRGTGQTTGTSGGWYGNANISFLGSGTASNGNATWILQNTTGAALTGFTISFKGLLFKTGTAAPTVTASYSTSASATNPAAGAQTAYSPAISFTDAVTASGQTFNSTVTLAIPNNNYVFIRFIFAGGSSSDNLGIDDVVFTPVAASATPTITATPTTLTGNNNTTFGTNSGNQTYSVSGTNLGTNNLVITPPAGFQVSTSSTFASGNGTNASPLNIAPTAGAVSSTTIYVRIPSTTNAATYSGNISNASTGASTVNVATVSSVVSKATPAITFANINKTYGDANFTVAATSNSDGAFTSYTSGNTSVATISGSTVTIAGVGTSIITANQAAGTNHNAGSATCTLSVSPKTITLTGASGVSKVYDRTADASISGGTLNGVIGADVVTASTGTFAQATVGSGIAVTVNLSGANSTNYSLTQPGITANITAKPVNITGLSATSRAFDAGNTSAEITGTPSVSADILSPDAVSISGTATGSFANDAVGNNKTVTVSGLSLTGANAPNYSLNPLTLTANITAVALTDQTITFNALADKTYGDANFNLSASASSGLTVTYSSSNTSVATISGNTVTIVGAGTTTITASQGGNGSFNPAQNQTQDLQVVQKELTISGISINNKTYDATTDATIAGSASLVGIVGSDDVTTSGTSVASFASKNVANGIGVTVSGYTLSGADAGNYSLAQPSGLSANITPATLTITGATVTAKQYDATTTAAITGGTLSGVLGADVVTLNSASVVANFNNATVGTAKPVSISGYALSGADAGNYNLTQPTGITGNITAKPLTITGLTAPNREYDQTTAASIGGTAILNGVIGSEVVSVTGTAVGTYADKTVGTAKVITVSGLTLAGADAGNYSLTAPTTTANITTKAITLTGATAQNKVANGNNAATITGGTLNGVIGDDVVTAATGTFAQITAGNNIAVTVILSGADGANYTLTQPGLTANITVTIVGGELTASGYTQNFSGITTATPTGWTVGGGTTLTAASGSFTSGAAYNFSATVTTDKAIGVLNSGSYTSPKAIVLTFTNNSGGTVTSLVANWNYEKYRTGTRAFGWTFAPSAGSVSSGTGTLNYAADANSTTYGTPVSTTAVGPVTITGLNLAVGATMTFTWTYTGVGGSTNGQASGIDDLAITIPAPIVEVRESNTVTASYTYATLPYNVTETSDATFAVKNTGNSNLSISGLAINGTDAAQFTIVSPTTGFPISVAANATQNVVVRFTRPTVASTTTYSANLAIANNSAVNPVNIALGGGASAAPTAPSISASLLSANTRFDAAGISANVTGDGGASPITARGVVFALATDADPEIGVGNSLFQIEDAAATLGSFIAYQRTLTPATAYKARAYATNSVGTAYSEVVTFTTSNGAPTTSASAFVISNVTNTKATITFTAGNGVSRVVKIGTATLTIPANGTLPTATTVYAGNNQVVLSATGNTVTVTGLANNTTYNVAVYEASNTADTNKFYGAGFEGSFSTRNALFTDGFNNLTTNAWTAVYTGAAGNTSANKNWGINVTESESGVYATGFDSFTNSGNAAESYLVSKVFNLDAWSDESLTVDMRRQFDDAGLTETQQFKIRYTTSYTGNPADAGNNWQDLTFTRPTSQAGTLTPWTTSSVVDISGISGTNVRFAVYYKSSGDGSGSTGNWYADNFNIYGTVTPPTVTLENGYVSPAAMGVGSGNNVIGRIKIKAAINPCILTSVTVPTAGTYVVGDIATNGFKLRASSDSVLTVADATIGTLASVASGSDLVFTGLNNTIAVADSLWLFITTDISGTSTPTNTVGIGAIPFSNFNLGTVNFVGAGPLAAGPLKEIEVVNPDVMFSGFSTSNANINKGYNNRVLGRVKVEVASANATLTSLSIPTSGTFTNSDITSFRLVYSEDSLFQLTDQVLDTITGVSNGNPIAFTGFSRVFSSGTSTYLFLVANVATNAIVGNTFQTNALPVTNFGFGTVDFTSSDDLTSTGLKTIVEPAANIAVQVTGPAAGVSTLASVNEMLYRLKLKASDASSTLSTLNLTTTGTYISTDFIDDFKLYVSADSIFNAANDTLLGTATVVETNEQISFTGLTRVIGQDSTRWYFVSNNISAEAGVGRTFGFAATSFAGISLSNATLTGANPTAASGLKTFDGNSLALYTFDGGAGPATTTANVTFGSFTRVGITESVLAGAFQSNNLSTSSGGNVVAGQYYQFTVTPAASYQMNLVRLTFNDYRSGTGATNYAILSSVDGYAANIATGTVGTGSLQTINLPSASFATLASAVTFRIFPYGASSAAGNYYVDNVQMYGALKVIPVGATTLTNGADSEPTVYSLSNNSEVNAVQALDFTIADDAESNGVDATPTRIASVQITAGAGSTVPNWAGVLDGAILEVGAETLVGTVGLNTISFTNIPNLGSSQTGYIADNASKTFKLKVWFKTTMADTLPNTIDGKFFNFVLDDANIIRGAGSSVFADANVALASGAAKIEVTGTQATFKTQPTSVRPNTIQTPVVTVAVEDGGGFRDVDFTGNITLTANGGTLSGPAVKAAVKGFATFDTLKYPAVAFGVSLTATTSLGTVISESFNVVNPTPRTGYFRSNGSGLLSNLNLWEYSADSTTWVPSANLPSDSSFSVVISEASSITAAANVNLKRLNILSNGTLTINSGITVTVRNDTLPAINELVVNGTLTNNGGTLTLATDVSAKFEAASVFNLVRSAGGGNIPTATWHPSSTVVISGGTGAVAIPGGLAQTFGNFTWNQTGQAGNTNLTLAKNTQFAGNLTVASTGNGALRLSGSGESKIIVGGNYIQNAGSVQVNNNGTVNLGDTAIVDTLIVNGAFQLNGGTFTTVANNNRTEVYLNGNVSIGGSATISTSDSLQFVLGGSAPTTLTNSNTGISLGKLTVNKSGADSTSRILNIGSNLSVTDLTLVNGNVVTSENILSITGSLIGEGDGKKVIGRVGTSIAIAARGTTEYTFSNSGLSLSFPDAGSIPSIITVVRITNEAVTGATGAASVKRRYNITAGNNETLNATMKFTFLPEELNGLNAINLNLSRSTNNGSTWNTVARVGSVTFAGGLYTVTATGINAFSDWTLEDGNAPLPVTLVAFNGKATQFGNELTWVTASELNNQGFRIERSENGKDFTSIAFVAGKGTTNAKQTYSYSDAFGKAYYRLAQVDLDGKTTLSNVIFIGTESTLKASIAPNPSNGAARLIVSGNDTEVLTLSLISSNGKVLQTLSGTPNQLSDNFYALSNELKSSTYFVKVISANAVETIKFMKR